MRVPQVNERVKEAPAQALRAMFAGIGQMLLFTDKLRNRGETDEKTAQTPEATDTATAPATQTPAETAAAPTAPAGEATATAQAAPTAAAPVTKVTEEPAKVPPAPKAAAPKASAPKAAAPKASAPAAAAPKASAPAAAAPKAAAPKAAAPGASAAEATVTAELPLPNYDDLTVASLRARMRNLTADQLTALIGHEKTHANREDIIAMFERRIAKLAEG